MFTDAEDYSMEIELPLVGCKQNIAIFGDITRKDIETEQIFFDAILQDTGSVSAERWSSPASRKNASKL